MVDASAGGSGNSSVDPLDGDPRVEAYFGAAWPTVEAFADLLRVHGAVRGVIGPQELSRLWERHLLNSAGVVPLLPPSGTLIDVGSGGGLPGIVVAAMASDLAVVLLEPMARRCEWLGFVVGELGLTNVEVRRARAEEVSRSYQADAVTVRAVAPLDKLYGWSAPLVRPGGHLFALKGDRAAQEIEAARDSAERVGWREVEVVVGETIPGVAPTRVVRAVRRGGRARVR